VTGRRPVVVALGTVDPTLITGVLGETVEFVAEPGPAALANPDWKPASPAAAEEA
jgi:hypothetical protein